MVLCKEIYFLTFGLVKTGFGGSGALEKGGELRISLPAKAGGRTYYLLGVCPILGRLTF